MPKITIEHVDSCALCDRLKESIPLAVASIVELGILSKYVTVCCPPDWTASGRDRIMVTVDWLYDEPPAHHPAIRLRLRQAISKAIQTARPDRSLAVVIGPLVRKEEILVWDA